MANKHTFTFPPESHANRVWHGKKQPYPVLRQHIPYPAWLQFKSRAKKPKATKPVEYKQGNDTVVKPLRRNKLSSLALIVGSLFGGRR